jgi:hypothetical protein
MLKTDESAQQGELMARLQKLVNDQQEKNQPGNPGPGGCQPRGDAQSVDNNIPWNSGWMRFCLFSK